MREVWRFLHLETPAGDAGEELRGLLSPRAAPPLSCFSLDIPKSTLVYQGRKTRSAEMAVRNLQEHNVQHWFLQVVWAASVSAPTIASSPNEFSQVFSKEQIVKLLPLGNLSFRQQWTFCKIFSIFTMWIFKIFSVSPSSSKCSWRAGVRFSCGRAELGGLAPSWLLYTFLWFPASKNLNVPLCYFWIISWSQFQLCKLYHDINTRESFI